MTDKNDLNNPQYYINRELSHIAFNQRVLAQSIDMRHPLLERLKFLLIFSSNLDEFFEIRVAGLMQRIEYDRERIGLDGLSTRDTLTKISEQVHDIVDTQYSILNNQLIPELENHNIYFLPRDKWSQKQKKWIEDYFKNEVMPIVSPIGIDPMHPFPRLVNKSLNFIVELEGKDAFGRDLNHAIIPAPRSLPRIIEIPQALSSNGQEFVFLSSIIHHHANIFFPGMIVKGCYQFRITRNADLDVDVEGIADLAHALRGELHSRRFGVATRIEVADNCPKPLTDFLLNESGLSEKNLYRVNGPVNLKRLFGIYNFIKRPELCYAEFTPNIPKGLSLKNNIFESIAQKDFLLLHPFESFSPVSELVRKAAKDPLVLAIKQTLYRTGSPSVIVDALCDAARNGKEVTAIIELRARFDEEENLELASRLQEAGAVVVYGVVGYKTHAKMMLVIRRERGKLMRYVHLGTGNYHSGNARLYTDYSLLTANPEIGDDVHHVFQQLTGMGKTERMHKLMHAPFTLKKRFLKLIDGEVKAQQKTGKGHIILKCNGLTEPKIIQALYRASQQGVKIDLVIRGMCCLKPGIPNISDNIRVFSIVGRFLEHTRVYYFAHAENPIFCSSADLMERNLSYRVETAFPLLPTKLIKQVLETLILYVSKNSLSWELSTDGSYSAPNTLGVDTHRYLLEQLSAQ